MGQSSAARETTLTDLEIRELIESTSRLWEHLHIETVGEISNPFQSIGDVECNVCYCPPGEVDKIREAAQYKAAARKVLNWLVNGDSGLQSALHTTGVYREKFSEENIAEFAKGVAHSATAFMMTRKQLRVLLATPLIDRYESRTTMFGRHVIVNDWIDYKAQDIWGLNLGPGGLHLLETGDRMHKDPGTTRVLWDVGIGYKLPTDVTCMRKK